MIRMLIVGYCYGLRSERKLTQEVDLHLAYRWFCRLDLDDRVPHHSTFSENRLRRFRDSDVFRHVFEHVVAACMSAGLVKGEGFAVDAAPPPSDCSGTAPPGLSAATSICTRALDRLDTKSVPQVPSEVVATQTLIYPKPGILSRWAHLRNCFGVARRMY
jgi:hypothetical protein